MLDTLALDVRDHNLKMITGDFYALDWVSRVMDSRLKAKLRGVATGGYAKMNSWVLPKRL